LTKITVIEGINVGRGTNVDIFIWTNVSRGTISDINQSIVRVFFIIGELTLAGPIGSRIGLIRFS